MDVKYIDIDFCYSCKRKGQRYFHKKKYWRGNTKMERAKERYDAEQKRLNVQRQL